MNRTGVLWVGLLGGVLMFGCSDAGGDDGEGGAGGTAGSGGTAGAAGSGGTAGTGGTGGSNGAFGVVNVDFMQSVMPMFGDDVYVGDDGVLSSVGGTFWNPSDAFTSVTDADDDLGAATSVDIIVNASGQIFVGAATNELQDNGIINGSADSSVGFDWRDLAADGVYDLALYVYAEARIGNWTTLDVTHAGGTTSIGPNEEPTWELPGQADHDYILLEGLSPYEIEPGVYGIRIDNINEEGAVQGAQLKQAD